MEPSDKMYAFIDAHPEADVRITLTVASECAWSGELLFVANPNVRGGYDIGETLYVTGCMDADHALELLFAAAYERYGMPVAVAPG